MDSLNAILHDPLDARIFWGAWLFVAFVLAWASGNVTYLKLGVVYLAHWVAYNFVLSVWGLTNAPILIPTMGAVAAAMTAIVGYRSRSRVAFAAVWLWVTGIAVTVMCYSLHAEASPVHYAALNVSFLLRMLLLGGAAAVELAHRVHAQPQRARHRTGRS